MTVRELSKLYYLSKLIDLDSIRLAELESRLQPGATGFNGMPRNPSPKNMMEEIVPLIIEIEKKLKKERDDYIKERLVIEDYIRSVEDYQMRLILSYRYVDLLTWAQTARKIGGGNTEDSVKKMCYRFLRNSEKS